MAKPRPKPHPFREVAPRVLPVVVFQGGTAAQRNYVLAALRASSFPWQLLGSTPVVVNIAAGASTDWDGSHINLDPNLLDGNPFGYAPIQHEFGHVIDQRLLSDDQRHQIQQAVGGTTWMGDPSHEQNAGERFATLVSTAYWQNKSNALNSPGMYDAARFQELLRQVGVVK